MENDSIEHTGGQVRPRHAWMAAIGLPQIDLRIYDLAGRLVRVLGADAYPAGVHSVRWNGTDAQGRAVASGTYYARLTSKGRQRVSSLVLVR